MNSDQITILDIFSLKLPAPTHTLTHSHISVGKFSVEGGYQYLFCNAVWIITFNSVCKANENVYYVFNTIIMCLQQSIEFYKIDGNVLR